MSLAESSFIGLEVERSLENAKGFLFVQHPDGEKVTDLEDEAAGLLKQRRFGSADVLSQNDDLLLTRKMRLQIGNGLFRILGKLGERVSERRCSLKSLVQHDVIDRQGEERIGLACEVRDTILDRGINDRIVVELVRDRFVVPFEEVLVEAEVFVEELQRRFQALGEAVDRCVVEAFVVHTAHFEDDAHFPSLGEKHVRTNEAVETDLLAERAGLVVVFEDSAKPEHDHPFEFESV